MADGMQLASQSGWLTLLAILRESGERPPKRSWPLDGDEENDSNPGTPSEQLAKRVRGVDLK